MINPYILLLFVSFFPVKALEEALVTCLQFKGETQCCFLSMTLGN